jgi:glycosyltransferase involved in cell wall biosynthesis
VNILVVSNFYPPYHIGGYELGCRDVVTELERRGHRVRVLTGVHGVSRASSVGAVHRWLPMELAGPSSSTRFTVSLLAAEARGARALRRLVGESRPDVVYAWNMRYLPLSIVRRAGRLGLPVCYFVSDDWLATWPITDRWEQWTSHLPSDPARRWIKRLLRRAVERAWPAGRGSPLDLRYVQFASRYLKQACLESGGAVDRATVVHWGVDVRRFPYREEDRPLAPGPRLLYAGQVVPSKGVHTAVEATRLLVGERGTRGVRLTITGGSVRPDYLEQLRTVVREAGLSDRVRFTGAVAREEMPALYREHDILIFPSAWAEPFSITLLEAMASGLAVIGTATGGSGEILQHGINALVFSPEESATCAGHVLELVRRPDLHERVRLAARRTIEHDFELGRMVDAVERDLQRAAAGGSFGETS